MSDDDHAGANAGLVLVGLLSETLPLQDQAKGAPTSSAPLGCATRPNATLREQKVKMRVARELSAREEQHAD